MVEQLEDEDGINDGNGEGLNQDDDGLDSDGDNDEFGSFKAVQE